MSTPAGAIKKESRDVKMYTVLWEGKDKSGKIIRGEIRASGNAYVNATLRRQGENQRGPTDQHPALRCAQARWLCPPQAGQGIRDRRIAARSWRALAVVARRVGRSREPVVAPRKLRSFLLIERIEHVPSRQRAQRPG